MYVHPYRVSISSYVVSCQKIYWNYFHSPLILGFRSGFVISNPTCTNYFFSKAINFINQCFGSFSSRGLLFGFPDDYKSLQALVQGEIQEADPFYRLFIRAQNVIYRGYYWRGGALSNFRRYRSQSAYYFKLPRKESSYLYYPTVIFSTHYSYSTLSLGFESLASKVPLITPVDASCDPHVFGYPIPINSSTQNIYFFSHAFFFIFFQALFNRLLKLKSVFETRPGFPSKKDNTFAGPATNIKMLKFKSHKIRNKNSKFYWSLRKASRLIKTNRYFSGNFNVVKKNFNLLAHTFDSENVSKNFSSPSSWFQQKK